MQNEFSLSANNHVKDDTETIKPHNLPIFPLNLFLLPDGVTRLRIFERRYLKMISIAAKGQGFVILLTEANSPEKKHQNWGSWVEVINFNQGDDGVLEVDVKCKSLVNLISIRKDTDMLCHGDVFDFSHWSVSEATQNMDTLSLSLIEFFESNHILNDLYVEKRMDSPTWVVARWLELLPMNQLSKAQFVESFSFEQAQQFVHDVIFQE